MKKSFQILNNEIKSNAITQQFITVSKVISKYIIRKTEPTKYLHHAFITALNDYSRYLDSIGIPRVDVFRLKNKDLK